MAVNLEQLLYRSPGGIGRYTARLAMVLPRLFPDDELVGFVARHRSSEINSALAAHGLGELDPVVLSLPRPMLYEAWHTLGFPPLRGHGGLLEALDVVHAPSLAVPPRGAVPLAVTVHDTAAAIYPDSFPRRGRRFHQQGLAAAARRADLILTVSESAADEIVTHSTIRPERIRIVANGVDPVVVDQEALRAVIEAAGIGDRPYVLAVGSREPRKGIGTAVAAMARLKRRNSVPARLVLVGFDGWLGADLIDAADRAELGDDLVELGSVPDDNLWALYAGAAVFVFPSRHEGFGYPVLEAMSQGVPVVCSDLAVLREIAGDAVQMVGADDIAGWAEAIASLLGDPDAANHLGEDGRAHAAQWSVERSIRGIHAVYEELVGR